MPSTTIKYVFWAPPESYDPYQSDGMENMAIAKNIYAPLVSTFLEGRPQGMIAKKWETSKDGKTWRFTIRENLHFTDGTPITPEIVLKNFKRILWLTRTAGLALNRYLPEVEKWADYSRPPTCIYIDGDDIVFKFTTQPNDLFEALEKPLYSIANPKCFDESGHWKEKGCLYESGQYKIAKKLSDRLILENRHIYPEVAGAPDIVEFITSIPQSTTRLDWTLKNREDLSLLGSLGVGKYEMEEIAKAGYHTLPEPPLRMHYLRLNHKRPPFNHKALRQSIRDNFLTLLAKDPDFTSEITLNSSFIPPGGMGYLPIETPKFPAKATKLKGVKIKVLLPPSAPKQNPILKTDKYSKALESALLTTLKTHGFEIESSRDYANVYEKTKSGYFDVMFNYSGLSVQDPYEALRMMFMSDVGACIPDPSGNIPRYILKGQNAISASERRNYAEKINQSVFDEAAVITFTHSGFLYLYSPEIDVSHMNIFSDPVEFRAISKK